MELHPYFDDTVLPVSGIWYFIPNDNSEVSPRVGHTAVACISYSSKRIYLLGGADPNKAYGDLHCFDFVQQTWSAISDSIGFLSNRYEHSSAVIDNGILVFGGCDMSGNRNDVEFYRFSDSTWRSLEVRSAKPSPRTLHNAASIGDHLIVFSGGKSQSEPVADRQVHQFDGQALEWKILNISGDAPKARLGHVMVAIDDRRILLHGGMAGNTFYDDLHLLDLGNKCWRAVKQRKVFPCARAAHGACAVGDRMFVFGGLSRQGVLDDLYALSTQDFTWTKIVYGGPPPSARLDFAICTVQLQLPRQSSSSETENGAGDATTTAAQPESMSDRGSLQGASAAPVTTQTSERTFNAIFIHGGMNADGDIFDDGFLYFVDAP